MPNCPDCKTNIPTTPIRDHYPIGVDYIRHETCPKCKQIHYIDGKGNIASQVECPGCTVWVSRGGPHPKRPCHAIMTHHRIPEYFEEVKKYPGKPGDINCKGCFIKNPLTGGILSCLTIPNYHTNFQDNPDINWSKMPAGSLDGTRF